MTWKNIQGVHMHMFDFNGVLDKRKFPQDKINFAHIILK